MELKPIIYAVDPPLVPCSNSQLVKIYGKDFHEVPLNQIFVKFGNYLSPEVFFIRKDLIICDTPTCTNAQTVNISISFDGGVSYMSCTEDPFEFIENNEEGLNKFIKYLEGPKFEQKTIK